ncbi:MAG: hypothetical protein JRI44_05315 [Deltaproteobacteria bacterium]|nr:hypothetical protein [Deltaproteobacteria bacterium]
MGKVRCKGQSYFIDEEICLARQKKPHLFPKCKHCEHSQRQIELFQKEKKIKRR